MANIKSQIKRIKTNEKAKGVIHKNQAANRKSKLARRVAAL